MNDIKALESLVNAIEKQGIDIAPGYKEYINIAYAIAHCCREGGRELFHRICRLSVKYDRQHAEQLYSFALDHNSGKASLGTVFYHAKLHGVKIESCDVKPTAYSSTLPGCFLPQAHAHTCEDGEGEADPGAENGEEANIEQPLPPALPKHEWPAFLQQMIECGSSDAQRDVLLLGSLAVLGATINKLLAFKYGKKNNYPALQLFVVAPPASGKGVLTWVRRLAEPIHNELLNIYQEKLKQYWHDRNEWERTSKKKRSDDFPEEPNFKLFLVPGNNTATGMLDNLITADGVGLIFEEEADTISQAIKAEYGGWSDTLRKGFDHGSLSYNRRTNHVYRMCTECCFSLVLSGTPAQIKPLIPSAENGLYSRIIFYVMPAIQKWVNQFSQHDEVFDDDFRRWGEQWKKMIDLMRATVTRFILTLTPAQEECFNQQFEELFKQAGIAHGNAMRSAVARIAVNILRITSIVAFLRMVEELPVLGSDTGEKTDSCMPQNPKEMLGWLLKHPLLTPAPRKGKQQNDETTSIFHLAVNDGDFERVMSMIKPLYHHGSYILETLPKVEVPAPKVTCHTLLTDHLPRKFSRRLAVEIGESFGIKAKHVDNILRKMVKSGEIIKLERGEYEFCSY